MNVQSMKARRTICVPLHFCRNCAVQVVTEEERCVCHFFHQDFERCRILDKHLAILVKKYFDTRFIRLSAAVSCSGQAPCFRRLQVSDVRSG